MQTQQAAETQLSQWSPGASLTFPGTGTLPAQISFNAKPALLYWLPSALSCFIIWGGIAPTFSVTKVQSSIWPGSGGCAVPSSGVRGPKKEGLFPLPLGKSQVAFPRLLCFSAPPS